ncbi:MAG: cytochrome c biogenesis protein CcdA [Hyphomicrobiales bacterium]
MEISLIGALLGGVISFVSPCVLPLVPPYLCYMAGVSIDQLVGEEESERPQSYILFVSLCFVLGFTTVFVALGTSASLIGQVLLKHQTILAQIAGVVIIVMGLHFLGLFKLGFLYKEARPDASKVTSGPVGSYVMGLAFAFGWTPCIGPILATILALAGTEDSASKGALLLGVYSMGIGIPFMLAAFFAKPFMAFMMKFRRHLGSVEKAMGGMLVATGILFVTGSITWIANYLIEFFPALATIG